MPQTYAQCVANASTPAWHDRVKGALTEVALAACVDEPAPGLENRRDRLARKVLDNLDHYVHKCAVPAALAFMAAADLLEATVTDAQLKTRIMAIFKSFAEPFHGS